MILWIIYNPVTLFRREFWYNHYVPRRRGSQGGGKTLFFLLYEANHKLIS